MMNISSALKRLNTLLNTMMVNILLILRADALIVGVSRTSKTPLSMYLANKGYKIANIPLVPEIEIPDNVYKQKG